MLGSPGARIISLKAEWKLLDKAEELVSVVLSLPSFSLVVGWHQDHNSPMLAPSG
jgi:hypothetical protein